MDLRLHIINQYPTYQIVTDQTPNVVFPPPGGADTETVTPSYSSHCTSDSSAPPLRLCYFSSLFIHLDFIYTLSILNGLKLAVELLLGVPPELMLLVLLVLVRCGFHYFVIIYSYL